MGGGRLRLAALPRRRGRERRPHLRPRSAPGERQGGHGRGGGGGGGGGAAGARRVAAAFVAGHTHMDAQIFWDPLGTSTCWHGITSVVMGNCGFTLAPCAEAGQAMAVRHLERAEDISAEAMAAGIKWGWTTFPEYLDCLAA